MNNKIASYGATSLPGLNKMDKIKPDSAGYRNIVLGGFNLENSSGVPYPLTDSVRSLFAVGGIVRRRLDKGLCRGEYAHPDISNMSNSEAIRRLARIDENQVSHHIRAINLEAHKDDKGNDVVLTIGSVKPCGPKGPFLKESLDNPEENVAFSIRSFTTPAMYRGKLARIVTDAITYDYVNEGGILAANKFTTASLEELLEQRIFSEEDFDNAIEELHNVALEEESTSIAMIKSNLGWQKIQVVKASVLQW